MWSRKNTLPSTSKQLPCSRLDTAACSHIPTGPKFLRMFWTEQICDWKVQLSLFCGSSLSSLQFRDEVVQSHSLPYGKIQGEPRLHEILCFKKGFLKHSLLDVVTTGSSLFWAPATWQRSIQLTSWHFSKLTHMLTVILLTALEV